MAKRIKLSVGGVTAYPITITEAVADINSNKTLSTIISEMNTKVSGYSIVKSETSDLVYYLKDSDGATKGTINIPQDTFLDSASFNAETSKLTLSFNTASGKQAVEVSLASLVDTYTNGNGINLSNKTFSINIDTNSESYLSVSEGGIKISGINAALALKADSADVYNKAEIDSKVSDINTITSNLRTDLGTATDEANATGSAYARIAKLSNDINSLTGGAGSVSSQIENAIKELKGDTKYATIGALEDALDAEVSRATAAEEAINNKIGTSADASSVATVYGAIKKEEERAKAAEQANAGSISTLDGTVTTLSSDFNSHKNNSDIHITADERTKWNGKVDSVFIGDAEYADIESIINPTETV